MVRRPPGSTRTATLVPYTTRFRSESRDLLTYRADGEGYLEPGFEKIFLAPATGGAPRQLPFGTYHDGGLLSWSRDGRTLYFAANRRGDWESDAVASELYALDVAGGGVTALTDCNGPDPNPLVYPDAGDRTSTHLTSIH